ncbi:MAG: ATP-binding protein [Clostridiales bacterium]|jgi:predicted AAA+ superfamily ATPase|nr:ATP-binding protein [Clostridiales bacterium]
MSAYISRTIEDKFLRMSGFFKAVLITGARQVGKTTMLTHLAKGQNRTMVSLDNDDVRGLAQNDPKLFFQRYKPPILIDEVQKAPQLFNQIKIICDSREDKGLFWLTGSQKYSMMKNVGESLAGRIGILELFGFSRSELCGYKFAEPLKFDMDSLLARERLTDRADMIGVFDYIWQGGMPQVQNAGAEERQVYFNSYVNTYILRDVLEIGRVADSIKFKRFLTACAAETAQQLNLSRLAQIAEISQPTASAWLKLLESLNIVYLLQPYANNRLKRLSKTPKLYFMDTGLCAFLTKWPTRETLMDGAANGAFFETFAVTELLKGYAYSAVYPEIGYYRDGNSKEIDLFIQMGQAIHPLEIKLSANPDKREVKKFDALEKSGLTRGNGGIVCLCETTLPINRLDCMIPARLL